MFRAVVTFERDGGDPVVARTEIVDSEPDTAARKAVLRALPKVGRLKWESVVIVLDRTGAEPWRVDRAGRAPSEAQ
jgi:hypothetical protein